MFIKQKRIKFFDDPIKEVPMWKSETSETHYYPPPVNNTKQPITKWYTPNKIDTYGTFIMFAAGDDICPSMVDNTVEITLGAKGKYYIIYKDGGAQEVSTVDEGINFFGPLSDENYNLISQFFSFFVEL